MKIKTTIISVLISVLFLAVSFTWLSNSRNVKAQTASAFTFAAGGDHGSTTNANTAGSLNALATSGAAFYLAVGDMSYMSPGTETSWCDYVKSKVGATFPFEVLAGNHESDGLNGLIDNFAACLPDRIGSITGSYGKEYYFDYGSPTPLARFILIGANLNFTNGGTYDYKVGNSHYNWLVNAIDSARSAQTPWIIVGVHKNCITMGVKPCEIGADLMNLLINKKVDLVLQGHEHNYQRSKQLTCATANSYNASCVADDGSDNSYTKGNGPIFVINGNYGAGLYNINTSDSEAPYFVKWSGGNITPTYGFMKYSVTKDKISAQFVRGAGGTFTDNFEITTATQTLASPTPSPMLTTPTPSPSPTPTPSPTPSPVVTPSPIPSPCPTLNTTYGMVTSAIDIPYAAAYRVWSRISAPDNTNNSYFLQVDANCPVAIGDSAIAANTWVWEDYQNGQTTSKVTYNLSAGSHNLTIFGREPGVSVDRIIFASDVSCIPTDFGDNCQSASPIPTPITTPSPQTLSSPSPTPSPILASPTPLPTPTPTSTPLPSPSPSPNPIINLTFSPSDDAYIRKSSGSTNYGGATTIQSDNSPVKNGLLKFTVTGIGTKKVTSAKLRLYCVDSSSKGGDFFRVIDTSWLENSVTWNTAPISETTRFATLGSVSRGRWYEVSVPFINGDGVYSIKINSTSSNGADYSSKEAGTSRSPQLNISAQ